MFHFPGQREDEDVLGVVHKHPVVYVKITLAFLLVIVLPVLFFGYFWFSAYPLSDYYERGLIAGIFICLYLLYGLLFACIRWIDEAFDVFVITSDRLIDVTQITFFKRMVTSTPLEQIQDTTGRVSGFLPTILQYGDLTVQTAAGSATEIFIDRVRNPERIAQQILDWADKKRAGEHLAGDSGSVHKL